MTGALSNDRIGQTASTVALRWAPFGIAGDNGQRFGLALRRFSILVGGGLGTRTIKSDSESSSSVMKFGVAATGGVTWTPIVGHGWSVGLGLSDSIVRASGQTHQHVVSDLVLTVEL
ncbi:MAG: hypothetical protein GY811_26500 [Myxococcales bacterium]|nr:hypothetical protein [Myxococcales bacterium]